MQGRNREADTEERLADTGGEEREGPPNPGRMFKSRIFDPSPNL